MEQTIAAISTSTMSSGGISIVRISGENAISVADTIFEAKNNKKLSKADSHTIHYGVIKDGDEVIDEVLVSVMKAPNTYTREDVIEINCHGGILVTRKVLDTVLKMVQDLLSLVSLLRGHFLMDALIYLRRKRL